MQPDPEILEFLLQHLQSMQENDLDGYHITTHPDLTLYEWWVTPHRIDGIPFHDFMMAGKSSMCANLRPGTHRTCRRNKLWLLKGKEPRGLSQKIFLEQGGRHAKDGGHRRCSGYKGTGIRLC
jgi:hypothetical protein